MTQRRFMANLTSKNHERVAMITISGDDLRNRIAARKEHRHSKAAVAHRYRSRWASSLCDRTSSDRLAGWIGRSAGDAKKSRLRRLEFNIEQGLLDPPSPVARRAAGKAAALPENSIHAFRRNQRHRDQAAETPTNQPKCFRRHLPK